MKKGLILLILFCSSFLHAQTELDSLAQVQVQTQAQLDLLIDNLDNHHTQFRNGMIMTVVGVGITALGVISVPEITILGSVLSAIGQILVWDSDKWLAKKRQKKSVGSAVNNNLSIEVGRFENSLKKISIGDNIFRVGDRVYYTGGFSKKEATLKEIIFRNGHYIFIIKFNKNNKEIDCSSSFLEPYSK